MGSELRSEIKICVTQWSQKCDPNLYHTMVIGIRSGIKTNVWTVWQKTETRRQVPSRAGRK